MKSPDRFALVPTTLLDYPGKVAATVFLPGCHLRCPYCHNPEFADTRLLDGSPHNPLNCGPEEFRQFLKRRSKVLGGVVFSGGEALLHPNLPDLIDTVQDFSLPVKLDTAGLLPSPLEKLVQEKRLSYVAVDLKTSPGRYGELGWKKSGGDATARLNRTLGLLADSGVKFEVRTTVVPHLVDEGVLRDLVGMASMAPLWVWQTYNPGRTLNPDWANMKAPDEEDLKEMAKSFDLNILIR